MKRTIISLILCLLPLVFHQGVQAASLYPEAYSPVDVPAVSQVEPIASNGLAAVEAAEYVHVPVSNPCLHGCGYAISNCTRAAAIWREELGNPVPDNLGDARSWSVNAAAQGIETGTEPRVGAVGVSTAGRWGHVFVIRAVYQDGSFLISEANYDFGGSIRDRIVNTSVGLTFIY